MLWLRNSGIAVAVVVAMAGCSPAFADPVSLALSDDEQATVAALPEAMERCVGASVTRGDGAVCRTIHGLLVGLAGKVTAAKAVAVAAPKPAEAPKP